MNLLFGDEDGHHRTTVNKRGDPVMTTLGADLEALCAVMKLKNDEELVHYCFIVEGSDEHTHGGTVGAPCCETFEDSVAKTIVPLLNLLVHRAWTRSCDSRWTHLMSLLRKLGLGMASGLLEPA